jgi:hypothetical protein
VARGTINSAETPRKPRTNYHASKEIVIPILVSNALAPPIAWSFMKQWLGGFAHHLEMDLLTFAAAGSLTLLASTMTISVQTVRVDLTNPANMLRSD